ncbi:hypothetical protein BUALT_Bualt08G0103900 [Buddleja alternifolia]|uniref:Uncharacterized protein n=1 Tax=Buddleja alternifolia TaxID=168488 RepID=A0AAV6X6F9_9LAMI|nr:hypothetical protein BUALT_Bualt08G0103900 [Buddleja alternifolia]
MGDAYWNHRQPPLHPPAGLVKRPRTEFDIPQSGMTVAPEMHGYQAQSDDRGGPQPLRDTKSLGSAYDHYLQNSRLPSEEGGHYNQVGLGRGVGADLPAFQMRDPVARGLPEVFDAPNGRDMSFGGPLPVDRVARPREPLPLPPDASNTLYIEGLPSNCTKREVSRILLNAIATRKNLTHFCFYILYSL